jgi:hypothetical protein
MKKTYYEKNKESRKAYQREYMSKLRKEKSEKYKLEKRRENVARRRRSQDFLRNHKSKCECISCGTNNPDLLHFHHRNPNEKSGNVSTMANKGISINTIKKEIDKCDPLCANCHILLHKRIDQSSAEAED